MVSSCISSHISNPHPDISMTPGSNDGSTTGKPCKSAEEYHAAAEKTGSWMGGILVSESMTDSEIHSLLEQHNLPNPEKTRIFNARHIGYYVLLDESQRDSNLISDLMLDKTPGIRLSSTMYTFIEPVNKSVNGKTAVPVFLVFGSDRDEQKLMEDIISRNISLHTARIVQLGDIEPPLERELREKHLINLNNNPDVLFAFKEYLQADIC